MLSALMRLHVVMQQWTQIKPVISEKGQLRVKEQGEIPISDFTPVLTEKYHENTLSQC